MAEFDAPRAQPWERHQSVWPSGFLDQQFLHDEVTVDGSISYLTRLVDPDTLAAYIQHLQDYGTRNSHSPQIMNAALWLSARLSGYGYEDVDFEPIDFGPGVGSPSAGNVIASKHGLTRPEFRVIVGGHYDSISSQGARSPEASAPGADDNASGTAATLEIARLLSQIELDATVQFALFAGEEQGLHGSRDFVEGLIEKNVARDKVFYINMDMIGYAEDLPWQVIIGFARIARPLAELVARVADAYTNLVPQLGLGMGGSDHVSFGREGYPAIFVYEGDSNPYWHTVDDLLEHLDMDYEAEVVRMVMATVLHLATVAPPPKDVAASETHTGEVLVEWSHSPDADIVGYHIEVLDEAGNLVDKVFTRQNSAVLTPEALANGAWLRVRSEDVLGEGEASEAVFVDAGGAIASIAAPNPSGGKVYLEVFIPGSGHDVDADVKVVDASGRLVSSLHDGPLGRGSHTFEWNGTFANGEAVPTGIYFYKIETEGLGRDGGKIVILK